MTVWGQKWHQIYDAHLSGGWLAKIEIFHVQYYDGEDAAGGRGKDTEVNFGYQIWIVIYTFSDWFVHWTEFSLVQNQSLRSFSNLSSC